MKYRLASLVLAIMLVLAVPASAATWRGYGNVKSDGYWSIISGTANRVTDMQVGFLLQEDAVVEFAWYRECNRLDGSPTPNAYVQRNQVAGIGADVLTWITIRNSDVLRNCDFYVYTNAKGPHQVRMRVR